MKGFLSITQESCQIGNDWELREIRRNFSLMLIYEALKINMVVYINISFINISTFVYTFVINSSFKCQLKTYSDLWYNSFNIANNITNNTFYQFYDLYDIVLIDYCCKNVNCWPNMLLIFSDFRMFYLYWK
jgi:hypothetical protein